MLRSALLAVALLALMPASSVAAAIWLDSPPAGWNTPGAAVPLAPPTTNPDVRCRVSEIAASTPEQTALAARGWRLESFWPPVSSGGRVLIGALAEYDGMCRPFEFNVFVFNQGQYAGTLSPNNMLSRTDGSLFTRVVGQVAEIGASGTIAAEFIRYADTDPLCCPSRGVTRVLYNVTVVANGPVVAPISIQAAPAQVPTGLPATGTIPDLAVPSAASGLAMLLLGLAARLPSLRRDRRAGNNRLGRRPPDPLRSLERLVDPFERKRV